MDIKKFIPSLKKKKKKWTSKIWNYFLKLIFEIIFLKLNVGLLIGIFGLFWTFWTLTMNY